MKYAWLSLGLLICSAMLSGGCARAARDTTGFALEDTAVIEAPFDQAWQMTKSVLREQQFDLYTRDKRGTFVAYTPMERGIVNPQPTRTEFTLVLEDLNNNTTQIHATTVNQVYGVTLLTYPGWHDRKTTDNAKTLEIIQAIQAKASGGVEPPAVQEPVVAPDATAPAAEPVAEDQADEAPAPKKHRWYRKLNPGNWFDGKGDNPEAPTVQEQQGPAMAPAPGEPAVKAVGEPVEPSPEEAVTAAPADDASDEAADSDSESERPSKSRWYNKLNPKTWF